MVILCGSQTGEQTIAFKPLFRQNPQGTVIKDNRAIATGQSGQQFRERDAAAIEVDIGMQLEPVDARPHLELDVQRLAHALAISTHLPVLAHQ